MIIVLTLLLQFAYFAVQMYQYVFLVYILLSFFPVDRDNFLVKFISSICEPLYMNLRKVLPPLRIGMLDLSPIYVFIFLYMVEFIILRLSQMLHTIG